jgi:O-methyltransferase
MEIAGYTERMHFLRRVFWLLVATLSFIGLAALMIVAKILLHPPLAKPPAAPVACALKVSPQPQTPEELYLDLLKKTLTRAQVAGRYERHTVRPRSGVIRVAYGVFSWLLQAKGFELVRVKTSNLNAYMDASNFDLDRLEDGETMVGLKQLDNVQFCVTDVLHGKIAGDLIEAGAWRGGVTILMRAVLKAYGDKDRKVWVADSFEGLPAFDPAKNTGPWAQGQMAVSLDEAKENFAGYGLLDDRVWFLKGFFSKTLPGAPITKLAVLRSDADLYESTLDVLNNLYPKLSVGGYAIFDDYSAPGCKKAIDEYRASHGITEPIRTIDSLAIYWRREK